MIGELINNLVKTSLDLKKKVDTAKFGLFISSNKKEKAQNLLDSVMAAAYPYIRYNQFCIILCGKLKRSSEYFVNIYFV